MSITNGSEHVLPELTGVPANSASTIKTEDLSNGRVDSTSVGNEDSTARQQAPEKTEKICGVCNDQEARYRCSRCQIRYCSVACATMHRATHPAVVDETPAIAAVVEPSVDKNISGTKPVAGTKAAAGSSSPFAVLESAAALQNLFAVYPRLRTQLRDIYAATLPPSDEPSGGYAQYGDHSRNFNRRGRGHGNIGRGSEGAMWNQDRGIQNGIDALSIAKDHYGKAGEGVREYAGLVLKLVAMEGVDVAHLVQEEVAQENASIIAQMLNGERT